MNNNFKLIPLSLLIFITLTCQKNENENYFEEIAKAIYEKDDGDSEDELMEADSEDENFDKLISACINQRKENIKAKADILIRELTTEEPSETLRNKGFVIGTREEMESKLDDKAKLKIAKYRRETERRITSLIPLEEITLQLSQKEKISFIEKMNHPKE